MRLILTLTSQTACARVLEDFEGDRRTYSVHVDWWDSPVSLEASGLRQHEAIRVARGLIAHASPSDAVRFGSDLPPQGSPGASGDPIVPPSTLNSSSVQQRETDREKTAFSFLSRFS
jgi:hypothetical protein